MVPSKQPRSDRTTQRNFRRTSGSSRIADADLCSGTGQDCRLERLTEGCAARLSPICTTFVRQNLERQNAVVEAARDVLAADKTRGPYAMGHLKDALAASMWPGRRTRSPMTSAEPVHCCEHCLNRLQLSVLSVVVGLLLLVNHPELDQPECQKRALPPIRSQRPGSWLRPSQDAAATHRSARVAMLVTVPYASQYGRRRISFGQPPPDQVRVSFCPDAVSTKSMNLVSVELTAAKRASHASAGRFVALGSVTPHGGADKTRATGAADRIAAMV